MATKEGSGEAACGMIRVTPGWHGEGKQRPCVEVAVGLSEDGVRVCSACAKGMEEEGFRVEYFASATPPTGDPAATPTTKGEP